jgi:DNA-binding HxlR family transcriptional regulator
VSATNKTVRSEDDENVQCVAANDVVALLRDKWTILVLGALSHHRSLRYTELQRAVTGISQRMLTLSLKTLEENGLVKRTILAAVPVRVDYELTPIGRSLRTPLKALLEWSVEHHSEMAEARRTYASKDDDHAVDEKSFRTHVIDRGE